MPVQFRIDDITDNNDGTITFQIGPYGIQRDKTWLFDRSSFDSKHLIKNMRLSYHVGSKPNLASREFLDAVNSGQKGIDLADGTWFIRTVILSDNGSNNYIIGFSQNKNGPVSQTIEISGSDIEQNSNETPEDIMDNVRSFLRVANFTDLTQGAKSALLGKVFWA